MATPPLPSFLTARTATPASAPAPTLRLMAARPMIAPPPPQPELKPVYSPQGQLLGFVAVPPGSVPPPPAAPKMSKDQLMGRAILGTATTGLGVASVAFPPALPFAAVTGGISALDQHIGEPIAKSVGFVVNGVGTVGSYAVDGVVKVGKGIGDFFTGLFK